MVTEAGNVYTFGAQQDGELCRRRLGGKFNPPGIIDGPRGMYKDACSSEVGVEAVHTTACCTAFSHRTSIRWGGGLLPVLAARLRIFFWQSWILLQGVVGGGGRRGVRRLFGLHVYLP